MIKEVSKLCCDRPWYTHFLNRDPNNAVADTCRGGTLATHYWDEIHSDLMKMQLQTVSLEGGKNNLIDRAGHDIMGKYEVAEEMEEAVLKLQD